VHFVLCIVTLSRFSCETIFTYNVAVLTCRLDLFRRLVYLVLLCALVCI